MRTTVTIPPAAPRDFGPVIDAFVKVSRLEQELVRAKERFDRLFEEYATPAVATYRAQRHLKGLTRLGTDLEATCERLVRERSEFGQEELAALDG